MPVPLHDAWREPARPQYYQEVSADGMYAVRVPVALFGSAEEALAHAQRTAQRMIAEQYRPVPPVNAYVDGNGHLAYHPLHHVAHLPHELTAREYAAYQADNLRSDMWTIAPTSPPLLPLTPEELLERERHAAASREREVERVRRCREREQRRRDAHRKGLKTLRRMLNPEQLQEYEARGAFKVKGSEGNLYEIDTTYGYSGNVHWIDSKNSARLGSFCCHPEMYGKDLQGESDQLPVSDAYIAQKLVLEADELTFLRTTVLNEGDFPPVVREKHADGLRGWQRCRCRGCRSTSW